MREKNVLKVKEILNITEFLEKSSEELYFTQNEVQNIEKIVNLILDGEYMTFYEYEDFMREDPITEVYITLWDYINEYGLPDEFYKLIPEGVFKHTKEVLKNKLNELLRTTEKIIGFKA